MPPPARAGRVAHRQPRRRAGEGDGLRLDPATRRDLIVDATERLLAEHDPLLVTFEQVATAAGVSRPLVHAYVGDRRGLIDAVQVRIVARLDTWVGHGLARASTREERLAAVVHGLFSFVDAERDAWGVLAASGGFDHPAFHGVRARWCRAWSVDDDPGDPAATAAVAALVGAVGTWSTRGTEPAEALAIIRRVLGAPAP